MRRGVKRVFKGPSVLQRSFRSAIPVTIGSVTLTPGKKYEIKTENKTRTVIYEGEEDGSLKVETLNVFGGRSGTYVFIVPDIIISVKPA